MNDPVVKLEGPAQIQPFTGGRSCFVSFGVDSQVRIWAIIPLLVVGRGVKVGVFNVIVAASRSVSYTAHILIGVCHSLVQVRWVYAIPVCTIFVAHFGYRFNFEHRFNH